MEIEPRVVGAHGGLEVTRGLRGVEADLDLGLEVGVEVDPGEGDSAWPSEQGKVGRRQGVKKLHDKEPRALATERKQHSDHNHSASPTTDRVVNTSLHPACII